MTQPVTHATIRGWLELVSAGTLATILDDARAPGAPFGSAVPFALDAQGRVIVLLSELAVHTKNLRKDPRASFLAQEPGTDALSGGPQAGWRVTLVGKMRIVDGSEAWGALERYRARHPSQSELPGFFTWVLDVDAVRFIEGFGRMGWL